MLDLRCNPLSHAASVGIRTQLLSMNGEEQPCARRQHVRSNGQFSCGTWVVGWTVVVTNQDCDLRRRKANPMLNGGNTRRINSRLWGIKSKTSLPKYPTCVVTIGMDLETGLQSAEHMDVSTLRKFMPIGGWVGSNLIYLNSKVACNPKSSWWHKK
jgi:hypothetical protein